MSAITHRGVTSEITAWHGSYLNGLPRTDYSAVVSYDEGGVKISAEKHWITTRSEAEAIVAKYRARWERPSDDERTTARNAAILHDANHDCREQQR